MRYPQGSRHITERRREILVMLSNGHTVRDIANALGLSKKTIEHHMRVMHEHYGSNNPTSLCACALRSRDIV